MSDKILIIDFEDSFTFNIANILFPYEKKCRVISHIDFFSALISECLISKNKIAIILGPGPGHPDHYRAYYPAIKELMMSKNIYLMGICLGHQLMGKVSGFEISYAKNQVHGLAVRVEFKGQSLLVQRYNSLAVFDKNKELNICEYANGISYQFHPESIGTTHNDLFFQDLLAFIQD